MRPARTRLARRNALVLALLAALLLSAFAPAPTRADEALPATGADAAEWVKVWTDWLPSRAFEERLGGVGTVTSGRDRDAAPPDPNVTADEAHTAVADKSAPGRGPAGGVPRRGWCARDLPAAYVVNASGGPAWGFHAIRSGFARWDDRRSWLSFAFAGLTDRRGAMNDGVNVVWFQSTPEPFLGRTWVYGQANKVVGFDVQLNTHYPLTVDGSGFDLESIVAHEAGHAAGFGHSPRREDLMYGGGLPPGQVRRELRDGDVRVLTTRYPYGDRRAVLIRAKGPTRMPMGQTRWVRATFENRGFTPWGGPFGPAEVRTAAPRNRSSAFAHWSWERRSHPANAPGTVCHGERTTVRWQLWAPLNGRCYRESFGLVASRRWMVERAPSFRVCVSLL